MKNIKFLLLVAILGLCQLTVNAEPGVLEAIFRSFENSNTQIITSNSYEDEMVLIRVVDENENSIAFEASMFVSAYSKTKLNCELPRGNYKVVFINIEQNAKMEIHPLKIY